MSAILPNDMLFHIVSHLDASGTHSKSVRRALVRLAQAHSTFKKPALATLWRSLPDAKALEHLLCVLGIAQEHLQGTRQDSARLVGVLTCVGSVSALTVSLIEVVRNARNP